MPRGRPRKTDAPEATPADLRDQTPPTQSDENPQMQAEQGSQTEPESDSLNMNVAQYFEYFQLDTQPEELVEDFIAKLTRQQALAQGMQTLIISPPDRVAMPEGTPQPIQDFIEYFELHRFFQRDELVSHIDAMTSALRMEQSELGAPSAPYEARQESSSDTLLEYMTENFRDDIRGFMQNFGINGHQPESVFDAISGIVNKFRGEQSAAETHAGQQEQIPAPDQQQGQTPAEPPIPLNVKITSLEMDDNTRALATAEYGDLTIRRIRVKQDDYGTLSVAMPKFRQANGWKETCNFNTVEARNRLTGAVLDAYGQTMAQIQGQNAAEATAPEQGVEPEEGHGFEEPEQGGPVMGGMSQW